MRRRCLNPKYPEYHYYGGRGISVCAKWRKSFLFFWADMGLTWKEGLTLDRKDTNGNYEPGNCRWTTPAIQNIGRRKWGQTSAFRGVCWDATNEGWMSQIQVSKKKIHLGRFKDEVAAAKAYDAAALQHYGADALLNFSKT